MKVHMPTRNTSSHTRSVLVSTPWAVQWCRGPVRVTLRYRYYFTLKTGTFTGSCLLTMGSHHTNRRPGTDSLVICSQNRFWYPKLLPTARSARMGLTRRQKTSKHPKTLLNHSVRDGFWRPQVAARRSNTVPRLIRAAPTVGAPSGACGRTTYAVSYTTPTWHLGPDCGAFWPRASILPLKSGAQSNQALVVLRICGFARRAHKASHQVPRHRCFFPDAFLS